jgi:hypothetical protein
VQHACKSFSPSEPKRPRQADEEAPYSSYAFDLASISVTEDLTALGYDCPFFHITKSGR